MESKVQVMEFKWDSPTPIGKGSELEKKLKTEVMLLLDQGINCSAENPCNLFTRIKDRLVLLWGRK